MSIELVSYADLKAFLDLEGDTIADYPALGIIQAGVVSAIEIYLKRSLEKIERTETRYYGDVPTRIIHLDAIPIDSVSAVTLTEYDTDTTLTSSDYDITDWGIRLCSQVKNCKVSVTYTGGWEESDVPAAVARAALLQIAYEFQSKDQVGAEYVSTEGGSVSRPELGLLKEVKRLLDGYIHQLGI